MCVNLYSVKAISYILFYKVKASKVIKLSVSHQALGENLLKVKCSNIFFSA